mmetsp:Transcript_22195/g.50100  ORF Transcript_22195/g.50100 Transcript_22195/m.50100 type:complete len:471 (+) Transcript_22195:65-1477(+)
MAARTTKWTAQLSTPPPFPPPSTPLSTPRRNPRSHPHSGFTQDERIVEARLAEKLIVCALLHHAPLVDDGDRVGVADRAQPVRDHDRRALLLGHDLVKRSLYDALRLVIERRRRLIEQQRLRRLDQRARYRHALLLPAREASASDSDGGIVSLGEVLGDECVRVRHARRLLDLRLRRPRLAVRNVLRHRAHEQHWLLTHQPKLLPQPAHVERLDVDPVEQHLPRLWVVEPLEQRDNRRLARAARPTQGARLPRLHAQRVAAAHVVIQRGGVREHHISHLQLAAHRRQRRAALVESVDCRDAVGDLKVATGCAKGGGDVKHAGNRPDDDHHRSHHHEERDLRSLECGLAQREQVLTVPMHEAHDTHHAHVAQRHHEAVGESSLAFLFLDAVDSSAVVIVQLLLCIERGHSADCEHYLANECASGLLCDCLLGEGCMVPLLLVLHRVSVATHDRSHKAHTRAKHRIDPEQRE